MGYIGFGLQKWIYKQKARRPFSNSRNGISEDSSFSKNFNVPVGAYNKEQAIENIDKRKKRDFFIVGSLIVIIVGVGFIFSNSFSIYENKNLQNKLDKELVFKLESYTILIDSGDKYFENDDYLIASAEYELAYKVKPSAELKKKLLLCYFELCKDNSDFCLKYNNLKNEK